MSVDVAAARGIEHRIGRIDQIPYGEGRAFEVAGRQIVVFRVRSGRIYALGAACPHRGGPLADGQLDEVVVVCPLHQNTFELATGCSPSGAEPVARYDVRLDGDEIVLIA